MRITVDDENAGLRLDALVARAGGAPSAAAARRAIAAGQVRVDGRRARKGDRVRAGQLIEVEGAGAPAAPLAAPGLPLDVLYQDEALVAVAKPSGLPSHPLRPGEERTLAGALVARFPECATASPDPREGGLAHRLDVGTSGVLVAARSREVWSRLRDALGAADCEKVYVAEVSGRPTAAPGDPFVSRAGDAWVVSAPIGRVGRRGGRVRVGAGRNPLAARTEVRVLAERDVTTLVEARLQRGRPHQVRVHLAHLNAPVVGDDVYGAAQPPGAQLHLHAASIRFVHPGTGRPLRIEAPAPAWAC